MERTKSSLLFCAGPSFALLRGPSTIESRAGFCSIEGASMNREVTLKALSAAKNNPLQSGFNMIFQKVWKSRASAVIL